MRNIILGVLLAVALASILADARLGEVEIWKIVLAIIGFAIFVRGSRRREDDVPR